jgi:hypothetical protein
LNESPQYQPRLRFFDAIARLLVIARDGLFVLVSPTVLLFSRGLDLRYMDIVIG